MCKSHPLRLSASVRGWASFIFFARVGCAPVCPFDLLFLDGEDLRPLPLVERKTQLRKLNSASVSAPGGKGRRCAVPLPKRKQTGTSAILKAVTPLRPKTLRWGFAPADAHTHPTRKKKGKKTPCSFSPKKGKNRNREPQTI